MGDWALGPCNCGPNVFKVCGPLLAPAVPDEGRQSPKSLLLDGSAPILTLGGCPGETISILRSNPFVLQGELYDQSCNLILDQNNQTILTPFIPV